VTIAGHSFIPTTYGDACATCFRLWSAIENTQKEDIGKSDIAHYGKLSEAEYNEIKAERAWRMDMQVKRRNAIWAAVMEIGGRSSG
jgi:hypothetical protein